jgi:hypothetical protein
LTYISQVWVIFCLFKAHSDISSIDASKELRTALAEEYANQTPPSDGEIYYKVRLYDRERSFWFKNRWKTFLSDYGRRCLEQVIERDTLASTIDSLVAIPGLRPGLRLSSLSKAISKRCDEVSLLNVYLSGRRLTGVIANSSRPGKHA